MGKWTHLRGRIPKLENSPDPRVVQKIGELQDAVDKVAALSEDVNTHFFNRLRHTTDELARALLAARELKSIGAVIGKLTNSIAETLTWHMIQELEKQGVDSVKTAGHTFSLSDEPHPVIDDQDELRQHASRGHFVAPVCDELMRYMEHNNLTRVRVGDVTVTANADSDSQAPSYRPNSSPFGMPIDLPLVVQWQALKREVKRCLEEGESLPPGCDVFLKEGLGVRKAK